MIFHDYEPKRYGIGSLLHIGAYYYKVLDIQGDRVITEKQWYRKK